MAKEEIVAGSTSPDSSDHNREFGDLEPEDPKPNLKVPKTELEDTKPNLQDPKTYLQDPKTEPEDLRPEISSPSAAETPADLNTETNTDENNANSDEIQNAIQKSEEITDGLSNAPDSKRPYIDEEENAPDSKRLRLEEETDNSDTLLQMQKAEATPVVNEEHPSILNNQEAENGQPPSVENIQQLPTVIPQQVVLSPLEENKLEAQPLSRKIEVPNTKVGVLIGKAGDTIRFLQYNSGAKIQITRDVDASPYSTTRPVELIGSLENINKAEQLIKDVIAEADAGGSPALVARGFGTAQSGSEQLQIQVPNEKVGMIIGKGGETIKNLQTKSGARIQLIPQHLPEGDLSKERTVRVTGNKKQIEAATEMIKEVMNQIPMRPSHLSGGYTQQAYRPRGPPGQPQWGPRAPPPAQPTSYDYQQRGTYPSQPTHYQPQPYSGYPQQQAPRSNFNPGWDQRPSAPIQTPPQTGGYDYYGQGTHVQTPPQTTPAPAPALAPAPTQANYYGQPQVSEYGQPATYPQSVPPQHTYGHGYEDPKYENQAPAQHSYGGQIGNPQPGVYPQQGSTPSGYTQQPYGKPTYDMPSQGPPPQSYGPPRTSQQPGDIPYQGPISSAPSYGSSGPPPQQSYPYPSTAQSQQPYPYGSAPSTNQGYTQPPSQPVYSQQGVQSSGYAQYPTSQPGYGEQQGPTNPSYGYQGSGEMGYNSVPTSGYGAPASGQVGYMQPTSNQSGYEQPMPQSGYGSNPGTAPVGYVKSLSPQPGYGHYESGGQMYGHH
ncbi:uncharacterized protein LOC143864799 isoform X2 [Tasmannia lanceolata]|uniref:uncharacterized protein LOC143864799 isoform X2 n=1 Tax=Tasmannia lanceolata TaxID=3420 RepID=UPI00406470F4